MTTVTLGIASRDDVAARFLGAMKGTPQGSYITFASSELLFQTLTRKRWAIIQALTGAGPVSIQHIARYVERDVKAVHRDVHALLNVGVLESNTDGTIIFPYDAVHVDFTLTAA